MLQYIEAVRVMLLDHHNPSHSVRVDIFGK